MFYQVSHVVGNVLNCLWSPDFLEKASLSDGIPVKIKYEGKILSRYSINTSYRFSHISYLKYRQTFESIDSAVVYRQGLPKCQISQVECYLLKKKETGHEKSLAPGKIGQISDTLSLLFVHYGYRYSRRCTILLEPKGPDQVIFITLCRGSSVRGLARLDDIWRRKRAVRSAISFIRAFTEFDSRIYTKHSSSSNI